MSIMASIDIVWLAAAVQESGVELLTSPVDIKRAWQDIAERYCDERDVDKIDHRLFARKWQNAKYYNSKRRSTKTGNHPALTEFATTKRRGAVTSSFDDE